MFSSLNFSLFKSKTVGGIVIAIFGFLSSPQILSLFSPKIAGIIMAIGGLLGAIGLRDAIAKGQTPTP